MKMKLRLALAALAVTLCVCAVQAQTGFNAARSFTTSAVASDLGQLESNRIVYHQIAWIPTGSPASCTVTIDSSPDNVSWTSGGIITSQTCTSVGSSAVVNANANYIRINVTALSASTSVSINYTGWSMNPATIAGPGKLKVTSSVGDFCAAMSSFYASSFIAGATSPVVDTTEAAGPLLCQSLPFNGWGATQTGGSLVLTVPILTDWPWITPTKFSTLGNIAGDCPNGPNAAICATATFRTNFAAFRGCTAACPNASTVFFATNTNTISAGTNNAGALLAGGTANFGPTCTAVTISAMCGMNFHICPTTSTGCDRSNAINLGRVTAVTATGAGTSVLTVEVNVASPITLPANGTGYQWYAEMPVVQASTIGNNCTGAGAPCISNTQTFSNFAIDAGDGASDIHSGFENTTGQEGVWALNLTARNARGGCFGFWSTHIQDSGPWINLRCGGSANTAFPQTIPLVIWQVGYLRGFFGMSLVTSSVEPIDLLYVNTINQGGNNFVGGNHLESATVALDCGSAVVWPWAGSGTGCSHTQFSGFSGNASTVTLFQIENVASTTDITFDHNGCGGGTNYLINNAMTPALTIPCSANPGVYHFGTQQTQGVISSGTISVAGCSLTAALGGPTAGKFASGTAGTCTVVVTLPTAPNGWTCDAHDQTTPADVINQTAFTTTSCTISGTTASGDVITFKAQGW